jgi:phosphonopyruvate decarboxylase
LLDAMEIQYVIIDSSTKNVNEIIETAVSTSVNNNCQYALIISEGSFEKYELKNNLKSKYDLTREDAIKIIMDNLNENDVIVSTTGKTSREVFEYKNRKDLNCDNVFLTVGSMGHCSQIAFGVSMKNPEKQVYILDGGRCGDHAYGKSGDHWNKYCSKSEAHHY